MPAPSVPSPAAKKPVLPPAPRPRPDDMVRVHNMTKGGFQHGEYSLGPNGYAEVPRKVADIWMSHMSFGSPAVILASDVPVSRAGELAGLKKAKEELVGANAELDARVKALEGLLEKARGAFAKDEAGHPALQLLEQELKQARAGQG